MSSTTLTRLALIGAASLGLFAALATPAAAQTPPPGGPIHAFRLYTGPDGNSHVEEGIVQQGPRTAVETIHFKTTAPHSSFDWHNDPEPQYVLTLTGTLLFSTKTGEHFTLRPGDVLVAEDHTGTGHDWHMQGDAPWTRAYVVFAKDARPVFVKAAR